MALQSTVKTGIKDNNYFLIMDNRINLLRKEIWKCIFQNKKGISVSDTAMALSMIQYELIHHSDEEW